jgi:hypothetical protein
VTVSRSDIDDAVEGYISSMLASAVDAAQRRGWKRVRPSLGPGDIPKNALLSMRRDVTAFVKKNEQLVRRGLVGSPGKLVPILDYAGWYVVGYDFAVVRNEEMPFESIGWHPRDIAAKLDDAAWAFPNTELQVGDESAPEPGRLYFWTEPGR